MRVTCVSMLKKEIVNCKSWAEMDFWWSVSSERFEKFPTEGTEQFSKRLITRQVARICLYSSAK